MTEYGTDSEPGVTTSVESELSAFLSGGSPGNMALIGRHDPENGSAEAGEVKVIQRASHARDAFGDDSPLTRNILDALNEGAYPVRAVASEQYTTSESEETVALTEVDTSYFSGSLTDAPAGDNLEYDAGSGYETRTIEWVDTFPSAGDADGSTIYFENSTTDFQIYDEDGSTEATFKYDVKNEVTVELDEFQPAIDSLTTGDSASEIDLVGILSTDEDTQTELEIALEDMADGHQYASGFYPAAEKLEDTSTFTPAFDNSRIQLIYPAFDPDGNYAVGSYVGMRARLGITTTPIRKRLETQGKLNHRLTEQERKELIDVNVTPIQSDPQGARVIHDLNTVSEDNLDEANIQFAYTRLVTDYLLKVIQVEQDTYIGKLNRPAMRSALKASIDTRIRELKESSQVIDFETYIDPVDAVSAVMEIDLDLADPLTDMHNNITIQE